MQLFAKNIANKKYKDAIDYTDDKEGGKKEYKKRYHHKRSKKEAPMNKEEIKDDVDSDGFEVVGSKEDKKQKFRDEHRGEFVPKRGRGRGNWKRNKEWKRKDHDNEKKEEKDKENEEKEEEENKEDNKEEKEEKEEKKEKKEEQKEKRREKFDKKDKRKVEKKKEKVKEKQEQPKKIVIASTSGAKCLKDLIG